MKFFFKVANLNNKLVSKDNSNFFNLIDNQIVHFSNKVPFQFKGHFNFSFDCFIMAIHFVLYLSYYFFYLIFGSGLKSRISLPFYKFYR